MATSVTPNEVSMQTAGHERLPTKESLPLLGIEGQNPFN
jgi:hypothetical protein